MTIYTVHFLTNADFATHEMEAASPDEALAQAHPFAIDGVWDLNFESRLDEPCRIDEIVVLDPDRHVAAEWRSQALRLRDASRDLLAALEQAVTALNTAPCFQVPALDTDSYRIAAFCDRAIASAKGGAA